MRKLYLFVVLLFAGCSHGPSRLSSVPRQKVTIYIYPNELVSAALRGDDAIRDKFSEIFRHVGRDGPNGEVGIGIVFPYLSWTEGSGKGSYQIPADIKQAHEAITRVAAQFRVPVLVQFNGAV